MADENKKNSNDPPLVERWLAEQQEWQRTLLQYVDSMAKSDDFLVHMGNAMRGSLLAGKPYPKTPPPDAAKPESPADDKLDQILFALRQLDGRVHDLQLSIDELRAAKKPKAATKKPAAPAQRNKESS